ncbi:hypothetical protein H312_02490 [Anncaliia algerae PRA339]|uniref:Uncharacterized protein n=1 Tax=Anncaliia algerae PRA339 TaxID=1288291 RepID=A0A059EZI0_9MICR|nr:hypothetical protein H312_02490 [Anncaliia algerae PRA339]
MNHKENFVDPITIVHTNTIEGLNNGLEQLIKPRNCTKKILMVGFSILSGEGKTKKILERFFKGFKSDLIFKLISFIILYFFYFYCQYWQVLLLPYLFNLVFKSLFY